MTPLNNDIISVPAGILERAGKDWKPHKEQFMQDKVEWLPKLGDLAQTTLGPGSANVNSLL